MNDNFYLSDLLGSIREDTTMERYWKLIPVRDELICELDRLGVVFRDDVTEEVLGKLADRFGEDTVRLLARFLHIYDFSKAKLKDIRQIEDAEEYAALADLLRLPGVRLLRAQLYYSSGVTLEVLYDTPTEEIQSMVRRYVEREGRAESVPFAKEINCHREVAKMILHIKKAASS